MTGMLSLVALPIVVFAVSALIVFLSWRSIKATRPQPQQLMTPEGVPVTVNVAQPGRTRAVIGLIVGIAALAFSALLLVTITAFWGEFSDLSNCTQNANTTQGEQSCTDQFEKAIKERLGQ